MHCNQAPLWWLGEDANVQRSGVSLASQTRQKKINWLGWGPFLAIPAGRWAVYRTLDRGLGSGLQSCLHLL